MNSTAIPPLALTPAITFVDTLSLEGSTIVKTRKTLNNWIHVHHGIVNCLFFNNMHITYYCEFCKLPVVLVGLVGTVSINAEKHNS